ncbi:ribosomal-protein-alanine acetyltransferase [Solidesulfovibrio carbinoliphilus subsp. oakridgensis]|uniref:Ribosomal-protein-alanine acetyltransferase n=2 Tax=Solidesulfovibrio carbinoliphilus TaxID=345370 RepID=G7Q673_9BACT|nr:ribosomal-protein-alanine acetyltransferase [Solidesulfovibrio carbinoliphilus subsp. oakridgensis]
MKIPAPQAPMRLGPESAAVLAVLEAKCFPDPWDLAAFAAAFARPAFAAYGIPAGTGLAAYATFHFLGDEFEVLNIATDPGLRGQGLAGKLFAHVLQHAAEMGMNRGYLEVRAGNVPARRLYARHGFIAVGLRKRYYTDTGEDALVMVREGAAGAAHPS